jgi:hypothetical protein
MAMGIWLPGGGGADLDAVTAGAGDVLAGKVILDSEGEPLTGTMPERGNWSSSELSAGASITIPGGHHSGSGKVTAKSLSAQTSGTATAAQILSGKTAWVNGSEVTGSMANRGNYGGAGNSRGNDAPNQRMWVKVPGGYYNENAQVFLNWADIRSMAGLTPDKIKKNVSIMGITGTHEGWVSSPLNLFNSGSWGGGQSGYTVVKGLDDYPGNSLSIKNGTIHITTAQRGGSDVLLRLNNVGDLTNYKYLKIDSPYDYDWSGVGCGISKKSDVTYLEGLDTYYRSPISADMTSKGTHILDISKFTGTYWIYLYLRTGGNGEREAGINRVYLTTN